MGFLAGLVPSAPGFSHQAVTDVGIMGAIPGMRIFEPSCVEELRWSISQALAHEGPSFIRVGGLDPAPPGENVSRYLTERRSGRDGLIIASGPLLTIAALDAAKILQQDHGLDVGIYSAAEISAEPDRVSNELVSTNSPVMVLENHNPALAKFERLSRAIWPEIQSIIRVGLSGVPSNGQPSEVMEFHGLDSHSLARAFVEAKSSEA